MSNKRVSLLIKYHVIFLLVPKMVVEVVVVDGGGGGGGRIESVKTTSM